jgi:hypothetical protein
MAESLARIAERVFGRIAPSVALCVAVERTPLIMRRYPPPGAFGGVR